MIEWISLKDKTPDNSDERILVYTPNNKSIEYRVMPAFMVINHCGEYTEWAKLTPPTTQQETPCNI